ncbi:uncharacterized protein LOC105447377 [Strongylocentrotus purpuratus]|uniref:CCHC-type domain-containing protein n=1 Tax=Strongylocentrotus purpuratus TaxID=7668 RepID=A0A7M7N6H7_STRPU|nr:uncharacterized protein LOC105447377 [Strongylocentrotus purpuratus]
MADTEGESRPHREPKPTEKGLQWQVEIKSKEFDSCIKSWNRTANKLRVLLGDESEASTVQETRDALQSTVDKLINTQEELAALRVTAKVEDNSDDKLDEVETAHNNIMKQTLDVLIALRPSSRTSSKKSKKSLPVEPQELQDCQDWVNDIQINDIQEEVEAVSQVSQPKLDSVQNVQAETMRFLVEQMRMTRLPLPEPAIFAGDPLTYPAWKHAFDVLIEQSGIQPMDRFFYLQKYLKGQPLELVRGYALIGDERAYLEALVALKQRYGDSFIIANAFRDKLDRWPKISSKDALGLRKLADFLHQCVTAMDRIGNLHHLNDERENQKLLAKLPDWLVVRWSRKVIGWTEMKGQFPPFQEFVRFIDEEAKIACYPITSLHHVKDRRSDQGKPVPDVRTLNTNVRSSNSDNKRQRERRNIQRSCYLCRKDHLLEECSEFASKDMTDRKRYIREKGLCYGCLKAGHMSKHCRWRSTCSICQGRHPSCLHEDRKKPEPKTETNVEDRPMETQTSWSHASFSQQPTDTSRLTTRKSTMIVPVWLSHPTISDERMVYALIDTQSDTTFMLEKTKDEMNLQGVPVSLLLSTMSAMDERVPSERIEGLTIRSFDGEQRIALPTTYTRGFIPANHDHIPTPEMAMRIPHLSKISHHLMPLQSCEVGLLIGYDCARALIQRDVIPPADDNGPYGLRTDLGWSILGNVKEDEHKYAYEDDPVGVSHQLTACEIAAELRTENKDVLFAHNTSVEEEITPARVTRLMEADLLDRKDEGAAQAVNSREVLKTVAEEDRVKNVREISLHHDDLPLERALGVRGCVKSDAFNFRITLQDKPLTRRGILSTVMSIYDPLGLLASVMLIGKQILQTLCKLTADWDDLLPDVLRERWKKWRIYILELPPLSIPRCYKPAEFEAVRSVQYHHFADASTTGYGQCACMRLTDAANRVHCKDRRDKKASDYPTTKRGVTVQDLHLAEIEILKHDQKKASEDEIQILKSIQKNQSLLERKKRRQIKKDSHLELDYDSFIQALRRFTALQAKSAASHKVLGFRNRWKKECLQNLQVRRKWTHPQREAEVSDIVIVKDVNAPRNQWPLARVIRVFPSEDGHIRKVKIVVGDSRVCNSGKRKNPLQELERPIHKLVLLLPREDQEEFPAKEPDI